MTDDNLNPAQPLRRIRSFVRRQGRITAGQNRALELYWPQYGLELAGEPLQLSAVFGRSAPVIVEIGFGNGQSLLAMAQQRPEQDFIGIEVHKPGVGALINDAQRTDVHNLRVFNADAIEVLRTAIPEQSLAGVQLFFPDPWHKKRHHKRRIVQAEFVELIASRLQLGGYFHMATDWEPYAEHMLEVMTASALFINQQAGGGYSPRPEYRPETKFEKRGVRLGHGVWDLIFLRR